MKLWIPSDTPEYGIHGFFVDEAKQNSPLSKQMHRILDKKYNLAILKFSKAKSAEDIGRLWQESLDDGDVPGPYWAALTHKLLDEDVRNRIFGDVHMLSHLTGAVNHADIRSLRRLEDTNRSINESLDELRSAHTRLSGELRQAKSSLRVKNEQIRELEAALFEKQRELECQQDLAELQERNLSLEKKYDRLSSHNALLRRRLDSVKEENGKLRQQNDARQIQISSLTLEQQALEEDVLALLANQGLCERPDGKCKERGLCGRAILYVGGRSNLVQHYRRLVEQRGGRFLYHDGGKQDNPHRLPELLLQANDVCCPLDCVSHDATMRIKRECKNTRTETHILRSSGLSSFARVLIDLST
jgi:hypothetical protein